MNSVHSHPNYMGALTRDWTANSDDFLRVSLAVAVTAA